MANSIPLLRFPIKAPTIHQSLNTPIKRLLLSRPRAYREVLYRGLHSAYVTKSAVTSVSSLESTAKGNLHNLSRAQSRASSSILSCLPLPFLLRGLFITTITSYPLLLSLSLKLLSTIAYSKQPWLLPSNNPFVRYALKTTLFYQYCAGETPEEVRATVSRLKKWGIQGILLGWAREVETRDKSESDASAPGIETADDVRIIGEWVNGTLQTLELTERGEFITIKLTGAGHLNRHKLANASPPTPTLAAGLANICARARSRGVTIIIDAEQAAMQPGIEAWTLNLAQEHNRVADSKSPYAVPQQHPLIMGTYQAYLKATPTRLAAELAAASKGKFMLGIKLVRGAYLGSDPRELIHDAKEDTDVAYNAIAAAVLSRKWADIPARSVPLSGREDLEQLPYPSVSLVLATHNAESVQRAMALRAQLLQDEQADPALRVPLAYAQLMGMADHISCELVAKAREVEQENHAAASIASEKQLSGMGTGTSKTVGAVEEAPRPLKYLVWGSVDECLMYLVRRAEENRDAALRTVYERKIFWQELRRRMLRIW